MRMGDPGSTPALPAPEMAADRWCNSCKKYQCLEWFIGMNMKISKTCDTCRRKGRAKQQAKGQGSEWAISIGTVEGAAHGQNIAVDGIPYLPPVLAALAKVTFQKAGMGCRRSQADPFLRLHAVLYCPFPGQAPDGYSIQAVVWKRTTNNLLLARAHARANRAGLAAKHSRLQ